MKLTYEQFKEKLKNEIKYEFPTSLQDAVIKETSVEKINRKLDALQLIHEKTSKVSPTIYFDNLYQEYLEGNSFENIKKAAASSIINAINENKNNSFDLNKLNIDKNKIIFQVINAEQNKDLLKDKPHRMLHDLAIIYRYIVEKDKDKGIASTIINNAFMNEMLNIQDENQLYELAYKNTKTMFPFNKKSLTEQLQEIMPFLASEEIPEDQQLWFLSNDEKTFGANILIYNDELQELAERFNDDLYIIPSSIHEVLAMKAKNKNPEELAEMVITVNANEVRQEERLSNQIYYYDKNFKELFRATDVLKGLSDEDYNDIELE